MFSGTRNMFHRSGGQRGFSLVELGASILLIAAIAVLSLPTYQDFAPHEDVVNDAGFDPAPGTLQGTRDSDVSVSIQTMKSDQPVSAGLSPGKEGDDKNKDKSRIE